MAAYVDILTLSKDAAFLGKISVAVTKYADFVLNNATLNIRRLQWGNNVAQNGPNGYAAGIALMVAYDANIQALTSAGGACTASDAQIQTAVETWTNRTFAF